MRIVRTVKEMTAAGGGDIGLVPTMGAFHEGHLSLMREARKHHEKVCVSLFVNPLQFGPGEDLAKYPRDEERDFELARNEKVDIMFAPSADDVFPKQSTTIHVPEITELWEGQTRPGHFDGVATVVAKLFHIVRPKAAYFGWKDLQQCLVIRRMVEDLNLPVELSFLDTVREPDGLALSSRNVYLSSEQRANAPGLRTALMSVARGAKSDPAAIDALLENKRNQLGELGFKVDYLELVSLTNLKPTRCLSDAALIAAATLGTTRLIDNLRLDMP